MARSIPRSPLFHKGLTAFTSSGASLPLAERSSANSTGQEKESSDNKVLPAHHVRAATQEHP